MPLLPLPFQKFGADRNLGVVRAAENRRSTVAVAVAAARTVDAFGRTVDGGAAATAALCHARLLWRWRLALASAARAIRSATLAVRSARLLGPVTHTGSARCALERCRYHLALDAQPLAVHHVVEGWDRRERGGASKLRRESDEEVRCIRHTLGGRARRTGIVEICCEKRRLATVSRAHVGTPWAELRVDSRGIVIGYDRVASENVRPSHILLLPISPTLGKVEVVRRVALGHAAARLAHEAGEDVLVHEGRSGVHGARIGAHHGTRARLTLHARSTIKASSESELRVRRAIGESLNRACLFRFSSNYFYPHTLGRYWSEPKRHRKRHGKRHGKRHRAAKEQPCERTR